MSEHRCSTCGCVDCLCDAVIPSLRSRASKPSNPKDSIATDKLPLHLVSPIVKAYQAIAHYLGNVKYGAWNWRAAGARASVYRAALERHVDAWWEGEDIDPADGTPHLANALACIGILIDAKHAGKLIDDRPPSNARELAVVRADLESLMTKIREKYKDKNPKHYTIADTEAGLAPAVVNGEAAFSGDEAEALRKMARGELR
jgi:hypothetical protein